MIFLQPLLEGRHHRLDALLLRVRQLFVIVRSNHLPVLDRAEGEAPRRLEQGHPLLFRLRPQILERLLLALLGFHVDVLQPGAVFVALEAGGDGAFQLLHQLFHAVPQAHRAARRQGQCPGTVGMVEIVDVAPVAGSGGFPGVGLEIGLHQGVLAQAMGAEDEQVVALPSDADAEAHRFQGLVLAHGFGHGLQLRRGIEAEVVGVAAGIQLFGGKGEGIVIVHGVAP